MKGKTLEEAAEIDLTNLCYYDKRNPDCTVDDEDIRMYSEEEVLNIIVDCDGSLTQAKKWFEQFKKK